MAKPVLAKISAFDCTEGTTITFTWSGAQAYGNELTIEDSETLEVVYNYKIENYMALKHVMDLDAGTTDDAVTGTFTNGRQYQATIVVYDREGNASTASDAVTFWCFTTPTITITNDEFSSSSVTISTASLRLGFYYYQSEGEVLNEYYIQLYDDDQQLLKQSKTLYGSSSNEYCEYIIDGLSDNYSYYINIAISTANGFVVETGLIAFSVQFDTNGVGTLITLTDLGSGDIAIGSNFKIQDAIAYPDPPTYINSTEIDLREEGAYVNYYDGFDVDGDYELKARVRDVQEWFSISCTNDDGDLVNVVYKYYDQEYETAEDTFTTVRKYYFALYVNGVLKATTSMFDEVDSSVYITIVVRCSDGYYSIDYEIES